MQLLGATSRSPSSSGIEHASATGSISRSERGKRWVLGAGIVPFAVIVFVLLAGPIATAQLSARIAPPAPALASEATAGLSAVASSPAITGAVVANIQDSLTLPAPGSLDIFGMATGGIHSSSAFGSTNLFTVNDKRGQISAGLATSQVAWDNYTTANSYFSIGGVGVTGFQYYGVQSQSVTPPVEATSLLSEKVVLPEAALVVIVGLSGGQNTLTLSGIPGFAILANGTGGTWTGIQIGDAQLKAGSYTVKETATNHDSGGTNRGDLLGVFAFANTKSGFIDQQRIHDVKTIAVGSEPIGIGYDSARGEMFVDNAASSTVSVISATTNKVVATIPIPASSNTQFAYAPSRLAYDSAQGEVFVSGWSSDNVSVISDATNKVVAVIPVAKNPAGLAYDPHNGILYVVDQFYAGGWSSKGEVTEINAKTDQVVGSIAVPGGPNQIAYDSHWNDLFVSVTYGDGGLGAYVVISCATGKVLTSDIRAGDYPNAVMYDPKLGEVLISNGGNDPAHASLTVVNDTTNAVVATIPYTLSLNGLALDSATGDVFLAGSNSPASTVFVLLPANEQIIGTLNAANGSTGVAYDSAQGEIFVTNQYSNSVTVITDGTD